MTLGRDDIAIHVDANGADRALLVGATGTGKSTAAGVLIDMFYEDYVRPKKKRSKPRGRILVVDTKPRWRPAYEADGSAASRRYAKWLPGNVISHSRLVSRTSDWDLAWSTGDGVVLLQNNDMEHDALISWCVEMMTKFFRGQSYKEPSLLVIDEGMDFFGSTGVARYGNIVQRVVRAGREKGLASLILVQRPKTINVQIITESNYLMLFHIKFDEDMKRLWEMGIPRDLEPPRQRKHFALFRDDELVSANAILNL